MRLRITGRKDQMPHQGGYGQERPFMCHLHCSTGSMGTLYNVKKLVSSSPSFPTWRLSVAVMKTIWASPPNEIRREEAERLYWREVMKDVQPWASVALGSLSPVGNISCAVAEEALNMSVTQSWVWALTSVLSFKTALLFRNLSFCFGKTKMRPIALVGCGNVDKERSIWCTAAFNQSWDSDSHWGWWWRRCHSTMSSVIVCTEKKNPPWVFLAVCPCTSNLKGAWEAVI